MSNKTTTNSILILDDEPHLLDWLVEYFKTKGYSTDVATNVSEAISLLGKNQYRVLVLDLNVPATGEFTELIRKHGDVYETYRGLYVAEYARNKGYRNRQVIVYSVHDVEMVRVITERIGVTYVTKGRPRAFKAEIDQVLSFDPSERPKPR